VNDLSQPSAERFGDSQLVDLLERLDEHVLRQFFGFVGVSDAPHRQRNDGHTVTLEQDTEGVSVARLDGADQIGDGSRI
jgi:hypothetical protein